MKTLEKKLLKLLLGLGLILLPFTFKRKKLTEWLLVFFLKGYISSFFNSMIVSNKNISYPIRLMPKYFNLSILFDYLLFPILCVFYNRTSLTTKPIVTFLQSLLYSIPMTMLEVILEKYTKLVKYKKSWNWLMTYSSLAVTFLIVRFTLSIVRKFNIEN